MPDLATLFLIAFVCFGLFLELAAYRRLRDLEGYTVSRLTIVFDDIRLVKRRLDDHDDRLGVLEGDGRDEG